MWVRVGVRCSGDLKYAAEAPISSSSSETCPWASCSTWTCTSMASRAERSICVPRGWGGQGLRRSAGTVDGLPAGGQEESDLDPDAGGGGKQVGQDGAIG